MIVFWFITKTFAYTLTEKDEVLVNTIIEKIDQLIEKKWEKIIEPLMIQIESLYKKYSNKPRIQAILKSVHDESLVLYSIAKYNISEWDSINDTIWEEIIFAAGWYWWVKTSKQIDDSWHSATKFDIYVNFKNKPVVLILGAYEPTIWDISISEWTKISKIILWWYHKQVISWIDKNFSNIETHVLDNWDKDSFYIKNDTLKSSLKKFGNVEKIYTTNDLHPWKIIIWDQNIIGVKWIKDNDNIPENYFKSEDELSWQDWIKMLVKKWVLRKSTKEDAEKWFDEIINNENSYLCQDVWCPITDKDDLEILRKKYTPWYWYNYYTALKDFTIPAWLYGSHLSNFYIPKWINYKWNPWHSSVYDFNTLKCSWAICAGSY